KKQKHDLLSLLWSSDYRLQTLTRSEASSLADTRAKAYELIKQTYFTERETTKSRAAKKSKGDPKTEDPVKK
ncbi:unnamed protein product, partial [Amoebophrya sp. A25]